MAMLMSSGITYAKMKSEDAVRAEYFRLSSENAQLRAERDAASGEVQRLREALEWYADEQVWMVDDTGLSRAMYEGNSIARAALEPHP